ncbi:glycosyltransferase family 2 protein, partial [Flavobacteriaceae bacterium]|nr:glycosyltransferase family 2 protein [Flavobacteriaceae bacterium]
FKRDNSLIAAQPKILDFNNKRYFEYAGAGGGFIDQLGYPYCRGRIFNTIEKDKGQYNDIKKIFWASGACFIVRSNEFKELNGFDENFFTHQEEIDLCWRIQQNGGIIKYIGNSTVYHIGGATLSNINPIKTFYNFRNSLLMLVKNIKSSKVWIILFMRLLMDGIAGIHFLIQGKWKHTLAIVKAHFSFYSLLPRYINKVYKIRKEIKYYHIKSIVWNYFIRKNRIFKELN